MYAILLTLLPTRKSRYCKYTLNAFQVANLLLLASKECSLSVPKKCKTMGYVDDTKLLLALPPLTSKLPSLTLIVTSRQSQSGA